MKMKKTLMKLAVVLLCMTCSVPAMAQFNLKKAVGGAVKAAKAVTLTDEQMREYVKEYIDWMDKHNQVCADDDPYTVRLKKLTEGLNEVEGIPLNFKVYYVIDVNAFACADGSVRVFSSLMDIMSDEELLGVIGHEVGHVAHKDSKNGFRTALLTSALKDGISSQGGKAAALTESQLGDLGEALVNATYSQKQEREADDYGYEFLKKAGKNPWAMALSFQKLKQLQEEAGAQKSSKLNQLFSTHPDLDARIKRMEERATGEGIEKPENKAPEAAR
jgi:peptidase